MDAMAQRGFEVNGVVYNDGPHTGVDYSREDVLQAAIAQGPVKIGIDADALPPEAGNQQGWYAVGGSPGQFGNLDHCTGLCGFGPASFLDTALGVTLPSALAPDKIGYLHFTWDTIGFVDHDWIMSTCGEAWLRSPRRFSAPDANEQARRKSLRACSFQDGILWHSIFSRSTTTRSPF